MANETTKAGVFVPEIATETATAEFSGMLALGFAGTPLVRVFPAEASLGEEGDSVKFPRWNALGEMTDMVDGTALTPSVLSSSLDTAIVQVGGKAVEITDFASLAARGSPSQEVGRQFAQLAARWVDQKLIYEAQTSALTETYTQTFTWETFVNCIVDQWGDAAMKEIGGLVVHSKVQGDLMSLKQFKSADELGMSGSLVNGFVGKIGGFPVYTSDRVTVASGVYSNLILKRGALGLKFQRELLVESDRDILKKSNVISGDVRAAVHLFYGVPSPVIVMKTN